MAKKDIGKLTGEPVTFQIPSPAGGVQMETFIPWTLVKRGVRRQVITPLDAPQEFEHEAVTERRERAIAQSSALVRALGLAHHWQNLLDDGRYESLTEIALAEKMDLGQVSKIARLALLAPDIIERCLGGPTSGATFQRARSRSLPSLWTEQRAVFGAV